MRDLGLFRAAPLALTLVILGCQPFEISNFQKALENGTEQDRGQPDPGTEPTPAPSPEPNPGEKVSATYQADNSDFLNPERGFHNEININNRGGNYTSVRSQGYSVSRGLANLGNFRNSPLSNEYLTTLRENLASVRQAGIKVVLRFAYVYGDGPDTNIERVEEHIAQLAPILQEYSDVTTLLHAGFVGLYGEWWGSSFNLESRENKKRVIDALIAALPPTRMLQIRSPAHRRDIYDGSYVPIENPFDGSKLSRIGFLNDCFLASGNDVGTYEGDQVRDRTEVAEFSRYTATSGETCNYNLIPERVACPNAIRELGTHHWDILNIGYYEGIINGWKDQGCFDEISKRLGYRILLEEAAATGTVQVGGTLSLDLKWRNTGFGKVYNPRPLEVILKKVGSVERYALRITSDARKLLPLAGELKESSHNLQIPANLTPGMYELSLNLPDGATGLYKDPRYSIRLANQNMWDASLGHNNLGLTIEVQ